MYYVRGSLIEVSGLLEYARKHPKLAVSVVCTGRKLQQSRGSGHEGFNSGVGIAAHAVDPKCWYNLVCCNGWSLFLYPRKTRLSLLITVLREKRHSTNSAGPSPGFSLGSLLTNYDDLLCRQCRGATCCEDDVQPGAGVTARALKASA